MAFVSEMDFTGERLVPNLVASDSPLYLEHVSRYSLASRYVAERMRILDVACGCGYGTCQLAASGAQLVGVDIAPDAIAYAHEHYPRSNVRYAVMDCLALGFPDQTFDCCVSFETLEHINDHDQFLKEISRVLKSGGRFIVSTPNSPVYNAAIEAPNPYHVRELTVAEFVNALWKHFRNVRMFGQRIAPLFQLRHEFLALQAEVRRLRARTDRAAFHFFRSLIPASVRRHASTAMKSRLWGNDHGASLDAKTSKENWSLAIDDIEISEDHIERSLYLIAVCEKR
ncbi:MAG: class I SAM-dependent methyltransferase [Deltaproteobacteria bacterium]|nr:class I SAM-dependent methyltransferase [Deltaproteobacteria bacterium]